MLNLGSIIEDFVMLTLEAVAIPMGACYSMPPTTDCSMGQWGNLKKECRVAKNIANKFVEIEYTARFRNLIYTSTAVNQRTNKNN